MRPLRRSRSFVVAVVGLACALALAACGGSGASRGAGITAALAVPSDVLVRVGTIADPPDAALTLVIALPADGRIVFDEPAGAAVVDFEGLSARLARATRDPALLAADGSMRLDVVLRVHPALPWEVLAWTLQVCADRKFARIHYAVRPDGVGAEGTMASFLPKDRCCPEPPSTPTSRLAVELRPAVASVDPAIAFASYREHFAANPLAAASVRAPEGTPAGAVLEAIDLLHRAGAARVDLEGLPVRDRPRRDLDAGAPAHPTAVETYVAGHPAAAGCSLRLHVDGRASAWLVAGDAAPREPPPAVVRAARVPPEPPRTPRATPPSSAEMDATAEVPPEPEETEQVHDGASVPADDVLAKAPTVVDPMDLPEELPEAVEEGIRPPRPPVVVDTADVPAGPVATRPGVARDDAVERALAWLAAHVGDGGGWSAAHAEAVCAGKPVAGRDGEARARGDVGPTALALLAFGGAGYSQRAEGPYGAVISRALAFLRDAQGADGFIGDARGIGALDAHALATLALVDAADATGSTTMRLAAERALAALASRRATASSWDRDDASTSLWVALAFVRADLASAAADRRGRAGVMAVDPAVLATLDAWLDRGAARADDGAGSAAAVADGFAFLRSVRRRPLPTAAPAPAADPPADADDPSGWWLGTLAAFRAGGERWKRHETAIAHECLARQHGDGDVCGVRGSWDAAGGALRAYGRVGATATGAIVAEIYFRYDRVFVGDGR